MNSNIERAKSVTPKEILDWLELPYKFFSDFINFDDSVIDIACGDGIFQNHLYSRTWNLTSVDYHDNHTNLPRYIKYDLNKPLQFSLDDQFDHVFSFETIEHLEPQNHKQFIDELYRIAKKTVIIGTVVADGAEYINGQRIFKKSNGLNPYHLKEYTIDEFHHTFRDSFDLDINY